MVLISLFGWNSNHENLSLLSYRQQGPTLVRDGKANQG